MIGCNEIYLGTGCKIMIGGQLNDGIIVGANAVVTKSFLEPNFNRNRNY